MSSVHEATTVDRRAPDRQQLQAFLRDSLADPHVDVVALERLTGGSSREIWRIELTHGGHREQLILRRQAPGEAGGETATLEEAVMRAARAAGVPSPKLIGTFDEGGSPSLVMELVEGETIPRRVLREPAVEAARAVLARECGEALGRLHAMAVPAVLPSYERLTVYRETQRRIGADRPVLELAYRWLIENRPDSRRSVTVHGDFRLGNLVVGPAGLRSVLDWESVHAGDPLEDLGWLCVPAWRFRGPGVVGGFGSVDDLLAGYEAGCGIRVSTEELNWGVVLGTWIWAVGCLEQCHRHVSGAQRSIDLAAVGRRVVENEADLLELLGTPRNSSPPSTVPSSGEAEPAPTPYGPPALAELLDAIRECLDIEILPGTEGRRRYLLQVCVNSIAVAAREVRLDSALSKAAAARREPLGFADDAALATAISDNQVDVNDALLVLLAQRTRDLLAVVEPRRVTDFFVPSGARQ